MRKIGIIGCGNMGEAILKGILTNNVVSRKNIFVSDINSAKLNRIKSAYKVFVTFNSSIVAEASDIIILAAKPQDMASIINSISEQLNKRKLVISVAAGVSTKKITSLIGNDRVAVVRVMPNMPALIGKGISAVCADCVSRKRRSIVYEIFSSIGDIVEIKEKDFDAVTAISGSGPAYFFYLVEALIKSGVSFGLKRKVAEELAVKTAIGSMELLGRMGEDASLLRKKVASKGGTTEAAFKLFRKKKLAKILEEGIKKARNRSKQLRRG